MKNEAIKNILNEFKKLSVSDRDTFLNFVITHSTPSDEKFLAETKWANGIVCPHCGKHGKGVTKNGKTSTGRQRYICQHCHKRFTVTTGSVMYYSKKSLTVWKEFVNCFLHGYTVRETAEEIGVNKNTAFLWRHKLCDSLSSIMEDVKFGELVEADETYFRLSYKGKRSGMPRKARKRGSSIFHKGRKRGLSKEQVCVPCAVNRGGLSVSKIAEVGIGTFNGISAVIGSHLANSSTICTDGAYAYGHLASAYGLQRVRVNAYETRKGVYSIQHINAYHSGLKKFIEGFNGVSTKHLNNYLLWFNFASYAKETYTEKARLLTKHLCCASSFTRRVDVADRPAIPYINENARRAA